MRKIIIGLVGLNLILAAYLAVALARSAARKSQEARPALAAPLSLETNIAPPRVNAASTPASQAPQVPARWASLASSDLRRYAANLRRAGCPEETIKEIMLAEVNRRYSPLERALKVRAEDLDPWETAALYDRRSDETRLRQLLEEKRNLLKDLTGVDVGIEMPSRLAGRDLQKFEGAFSAVPESKRDQVRAIQENYWAQSDEIKQRIMGYLEPEDRDAYVRIKNERREALANVLSPTELQDYELKTSATAATLKSRLEGFDVSDDEFRKIFEVMQPLDERYSLGRRNPDPLDAEFTASRKQAETDLQEYVRSVVGDERYAEYQRTRDPAFRAINQAGSEAGIPKETILQAYQAQQQLQEESRRIIQNPNLTQEQRNQALQHMRAQAEQTAQQLFGDKANAVLGRLPGFQ